jgi:predicted ABC-type ATPase
MRETPRLVIIAGPNGAGKSTIANRVLTDAAAVTEFVNADTIARGLSAFEPERVAVQAGRIMLQRLKELAQSRANFAFESTLATRSFAPWISELVKIGYAVELTYVWLDSANLAVSRVAERVRLGGHSVDPETVKRRYFRRLHNLIELYLPLAAIWSIINNTRVDGPGLIASGGTNRETRVVDAVTWNRIHVLIGRHAD